MKDNIKNDWNNTRFRDVEIGDYECIMEGRRRTALQNLARRYRRFSNLSLVAILWVPVMLLQNIMPDNTVLRGCFAVAMTTYFAVCSVMDRWLYHGVSRIDCVTMSTAEVVRLAMFYRKRHLQFILVLIPLALGIVSFLCFIFKNDPYLWAGLAVGGVTGVAIGYRQFLLFMDDYRALKED